MLPKTLVYIYIVSHSLVESLLQNFVSVLVHGHLKVLYVGGGDQCLQAAQTNFNAIH